MHKVSASRSSFVPGATSTLEADQETTQVSSAEKIFEGNVAELPRNFSHPLTPAHVLHLQKTIGNQAVQRLLTRQRSEAARVVQRVPISHDYDDGLGVVDVATEGFGTKGATRQTKVEGYYHAIKASANPGNPKLPLSFTSSGISETDKRRMRGYDRGHLVAREAGGLHTTENIIPQHPRMNREGGWKLFERSVSDAATNLYYDGAGVLVTIKINYDDEKSRRIPVSLSVKGQVVPGANTLATKTIGQERMNLYQGKLDIAAGEINNWYEEAEPLSELATKKGVNLKVKSNKKFNLAKAVKNHKPNRKFASDQELTERLDTASSADVSQLAVGTLPPVELQVYKELEGSIPSYLPLKTEPKRKSPAKQEAEEDDDSDADVDNGESGRPRANFTPRQRQLILAYNRQKNGGVLMSDAPNDRYPILKEGGKKSAPEVDHIVPDSLGGKNAFANARVISNWLNGGGNEQVAPAQDKAQIVKGYQDWRKDKTRTPAEITGGVSGKTFDVVYQAHKDQRSMPRKSYKYQLQMLWWETIQDIKAEQKQLSRDPKYSSHKSQIQKIYQANIERINKMVSAKNTEFGNQYKELRRTYNRGKFLIENFTLTPDVEKAKSEHKKKFQDELKALSATLTNEVKSLENTLAALSALIPVEVESVISDKSPTSLVTSDDQDDIYDGAAEFFAQLEKEEENFSEDEEEDEETAHRSKRMKEDPSTFKFKFKGGFDFGISAPSAPDDGFKFQPPTPTPFVFGPPAQTPSSPFVFSPPAHSPSSEEDLTDMNVSKD